MNFNSKWNQRKPFSYYLHPCKPYFRSSASSRAWVAIKNVFAIGLGCKAEVIVTLRQMAFLSARMEHKGHLALIWCLIWCSSITSFIKLGQCIVTSVTGKQRGHSERLVPRLSSKHILCLCYIQVNLISFLWLLAIYLPKHVARGWLSMVLMITTLLNNTKKIIEVSVFPSWRNNFI